MPTPRSANLRLALAAAVLCLFALRPGAAQTGVPTGGSSQQFLVPLETPGTVRLYEMHGKNQGWDYTLRATSTVKRDSEGSTYEQIAWSDLHANQPVTLSPESLALRQTVSLENPQRYMVIPDLSKVQPLLIGPITDTLTFYSDLFLAVQHVLSPAPPHVYVPHGIPNSWADGQHFILAQDAIDFDLSLESQDEAAHTATLLMRHVSPKESKITLPADWMKTPVDNAPNNWVQVSHEGETYLAEIGHETFDVRLIVDTRSVAIISAHMQNQITALARTCQDAALARCGPATPETIHREISFKLLP